MTQPQPASASARFLDESVLPVFTDLRMTAFGRTVINIAADPVFDSWSFSDKVLYALDKEVAAKRERRVNKLLKASRSPNLRMSGSLCVRLSSRRSFTDNDYGVTEEKS